MAKLHLGSSGRRRQRALRQGGLRIALRCTAGCAIRTGTTIAIPGGRTYKLARVTRLLAARTRVVVELPLTKKARAALTGALRRKRTGLATVKVSAVDSSGRADREKRRMRLAR